MRLLLKIRTEYFYFSLFLISRFHSLPSIYFWVIHDEVIVTLYGLYRWTSDHASNLHIDTSIHISILKFALQGAKKVIFTACHSGKLKQTSSSPNIISTSPENVLMSRLISQFFCNLNSSKNFTCPSGKLITEFTSPMAKSTSPWLADSTFFAHCFNIA